MFKLQESLSLTLYFKLIPGIGGKIGRYQKAIYSAGTVFLQKGTKRYGLFYNVIA